MCAKVLRMNNKIIVRFMDNSIYEEQRSLLLDGKCKSIFTLTMLHRDEGVTGYYETSGYMRISELKNLTAKTALLIAEKIIMAIEECYQYLFFPEEYVINSNTVYVDFDYNTVRIVYIPDSRKENLMSKYLEILRSLKAATVENDQIYLDMLIDKVSIGRISINKTKLLISKIMQEENMYHLL